MTLTTTERINAIREYLEKVDDFAFRFGTEIQRILDDHNANGGHLEYAYVEHFHTEIIGLSKFIQYLLNDKINRKYVFFGTRTSIEILLYLEHILKLAKSGSTEMLNFLSKDLAQSAAAINKAATPNKDHNIHKTLKNIDTINKILDTGFKLEEIDESTKVFPSVYKLCKESKLSLKDAKTTDMYHVYVLYSEANHARLSNHHSVTADSELDVCWALEYYIEIYIRFYNQLLEADKFPPEFLSELNSIKLSLGLR